MINLFKVNDRQGQSVEALQQELMGSGMKVEADRLWNLPRSPVRVVAYFPDRPEPLVVLIDTEGNRI